jgi:hypothetical protein
MVQLGKIVKYLNQRHVWIDNQLLYLPSHLPDALYTSQRFPESTCFEKSLALFKSY